MSATGLTAQAFGAAMRGRMTRVVARSLILALAIGLLLLAIKDPFADWVLAAMQVEDQAADYARLYLSIRLYSLPFALIKLVVIGYLIGTQRAATAMALELLLNVLNAGLTAWFVAGLGWGVAGAAAASLIAEAAAGLAALAVLLSHMPPRLLCHALRQPGFWRLAQFRALLGINGYLFLRAVMLLSAFGLFLRLASGEGETVLAATHVLLQFHFLATLGLDGIAYAAEALVGASVGARNRAAFRFWALRTSLWAAAMAALYSLLFLGAGDAIIALFTDHADVRTAASDGLLWLTLLPIIAVWSYQLDGIFIGATAAKAMMWMMVLTLAVFVATAPALTRAYGIDGLWGAFLLFTALRAMTLGAAYPGLERGADRN